MCNGKRTVTGVARPFTVTHAVTRRERERVVYSNTLECGCSAIEEEYPLPAGAMKGRRERRALWCITIGAWDPAGSAIIARRNGGCGSWEGRAMSRTGPCVPSESQPTHQRDLTAGRWRLTAPGGAAPMAVVAATAGSDEGRGRAARTRKGKPKARLIRGSEPYVGHVSPMDHHLRVVYAMRSACPLRWAPRLLRRAARPAQRRVCITACIIVEPRRRTRTTKGHTHNRDRRQARSGGKRWGHHV